MTVADKAKRTRVTLCAAMLPLTGRVLPFLAPAGRVEVRAREGGPGVRCRHLLECRAAEGVSVSPALLAGERGLPLGTLV